MSRIFVPSALTAAILSASVVSATAATTVLDGNSSASLPVVVVTASKTPEAIEQVPARISVIDEQIIQQSPVADLPHLLQREAALNIVQTGGYGQQTSIFTRGTESDHTLVLKDGVRTNTGSISAANINLFDLSDVSRIEVLKGPASVQYGSDAIGGVIQLISEAPKKQKLFSTIEGGELDTYKAIVGADLVQDDAYVQVRGQRLETAGSPVTDAPTAKDADYDQKGYSIKAGIDNEQFGASAQLQENKGNVRYNPSLSGNQDFLNRLINLKGNYNISADFKVNARYSQFRDELNQRTSKSFFDTETNEGDLSAQWDFLPAQNLLFGVTDRKTEVDSVYYNNKDLKTTGYYLQHQYQADGLSTQAGVRVEDDDKYGTHTVGQLAGRFQLAPQTSVYANIGSAFKAPTANELYYLSSYTYNGVTYITLGNPDLKPEESLSYELGIDQNIKQGLDVYLSAYQTKVKNLIDYVSGFPSPISTYENVSKAKFTGGEAGLKWKQDNWFASTEYAYVKAENETTHTELTRRPRQTATLTAGWDNNVYGISASLVAKSRAKEYSANNPTPGFMTANLSGFYQYNPNVRVFANIQNIGDNTYKTALYNDFPSAEYYIAGPRQATAGITLSY
ncbi:TonB-dependent receptor plug domain-containing protein [Alkanindiges illinoisensis]|uniref:TonB-dependent receptor n=1 Tax=Alkanindiges illinoisensis TaxID=197183 RepID=A0A4Y7X9W7_9GAMM|nr:TonB-dependent receptor [Alkanindiges illinoisensis]TEU24722.1 TonB-dependent receptor [Alkanindiges illinoisensis]